MNKDFLRSEYASINPLQKVPFLVHGDFKLGESSAIINYLSDFFNIDNQWFPKDLQTRSKILSYLHWHHIGLRQQIDDYVQPKVIWPLVFDMHYLTAEWEKWLIVGVSKALHDLNLLLLQTGFVAGTLEESIADVVAYTQVTMLPLLGIDLREVPKVAEWKEKIEKNQVVQKNHLKFNLWLSDMLEKIAKQAGEVMAS
jgi:glutathione S-transferase